MLPIRHPAMPGPRLLAQQSLRLQRFLKGVTGRDGDRASSTFSPWFPRSLPDGAPARIMAAISKYTLTLKRQHPRVKRTEWETGLISPQKEQINWQKL